MLYLSTQGVEFEGGSFAFVDKAPPTGSTAAGSSTVLHELSPRLGTAVAFSSGWENMHQVGPLQRGTRFAMPMFFVTRPPSHSVPAAQGDGDACDMAPPVGDAAVAGALWSSALRPMAEEDVRRLMRDWHELFAAEL